MTSDVAGGGDPSSPEGAPGTGRSGEGVGATGSWFDNHCHLQAFDDPAAVVAAARAVGVTGLLCVGTDLESSRRAVELAREFAPAVFAVAGLHPHDASRLEAEAHGLVPLLTDPRVVAVGEAGFDLHYEHSPRAEQERAFRWQIRLAHAFALPLVIHTREAWPDTFRVLDDEGVPDRLVFHCFTGGPDEARSALERGAMLSFSGIVSFRTADDLRAAAAITPADRLLVETDAPYLAPVPHRGARNEPAFVVDVGRALAAARGEDVDQISALTRENASRFFSRPVVDVPDAVPGIYW